MSETVLEQIEKVVRKAVSAGSPKAADDAMAKIRELLAKAGA